MNKGLIMFGIGLLSGAAAGFTGSMFYFRKKYSDYAEQQIHEMEEYYGVTDQYRRESVDEKAQDDRDYTDTDESTNTGREKGILTDEQRAEQREKLHRNWQKTTDYASIYNKEKNKDAEEKSTDEPEQVYVGEDGSEDLEAACEPELDEEEAAIEDHQKNKNKKPKIISYEEAANLPQYIEQVTLYAYTEDGTVTDEDDQPVDDPDSLIGDALTKYGFLDEDCDETIIFVRNYSLDTCFEIEKVVGSFNSDAF